MAFSTLYF